MLEQHLKKIAEDYQFPYNALSKALTVTLDVNFTLEITDKKHLKFTGMLPSIASNSDKEGLILQLMQLNLPLGSTQSIACSLTPHDELCLVSELNYKQDFTQIKEAIETFANSLDKISEMIQDWDKKQKETL